TGQHHAVMLLRAGPAHEPTAHVGQHALGLAVEGMAPAAAPAGLDAHDIAAPHDIAVAQGTRDALVRPAWVDDAAPGSGGVTPGDTPRRMLDAVDAHGDACLRRQHLDLADEAASAAPAPRPARVRVDGVAQHPHREHRVEKLG